MLETVGVKSLDELIEKTVPSAIRTDRPLALPEARSERSALSYLRRMGNATRCSSR